MASFLNRTLDRTLDRSVELAAAMADPTRARALLALAGRELCVCQLVELFELSTSTVSRHLSQLRRAGLVELRRDGRWAWYRRAIDPSDEAVTGALAWLDRSLSAGEVATRDRARLEEILERLPGPCAR